MEDDEVAVVCAIDVAFEYFLVLHRLKDFIGNSIFRLAEGEMPVVDFEKVVFFLLPDSFCVNLFDKYAVGVCLFYVKNPKC
jgi:hypothetical protein